MKYLQNLLFSGPKGCGKGRVFWVSWRNSYWTAVLSGYPG